MPLAPGSKLGPYEVLSLLGAGGMGEVYRARDPRLAREVAIKVLPAERMADETRRQRFVQEARAASALNHPNIVTVHETDTVDGVDFIVMEYVRGATLADRMPREGMRLEPALHVAIAIADALARAHAAGIVHCDLKPGNVVVSEEGTVKVLDFGLARLVTPLDWHRRSVTETYDGLGKVAGTIGYMSPEQAAGDRVDARSDVFSFGTLLYEMVTGRRAFPGRSAAEVIAAVMKDQPTPAGELVATLPIELDRLIQRCLRKEPGRRFQDMRDVKLELEQVREDSQSGRVAVRRARPRRLTWLGAGLALTALVLAAGWLWRRSAANPASPPRLVPLTSMRGSEVGAALSPDGELVAFAWDGEKGDGNFDIYVKMIGSSEVRRLTTDPAWDIMPAWSPDGRQIAFVRMGPEGLRIRLISPISGTDRKLGDFPVAFAGLSWSSDSQWLAARGEKGGLCLLPAGGGEPRPLLIPHETGEPSFPTFAPDGRHLAYVSGVGFSAHLAVVGLGPDYTPIGAPRRVTPGRFWGDGGLAWTRDSKSLLYTEQGLLRLWRAEIDGRHAPQPVEIAGLGAQRPATAPRSDRLVVVKEQSDVDIFRFQAGQPATAAIVSSFQDEGPQFSPDGRRVVFTSARSGETQIWLADADGSSPKQLTHGPGGWRGWPRWSPDGRQIAYDAAQSESGRFDVWTVDAEGGSERRLTQDPGDENNPSWSGDGRFVYFAAMPEQADPPVAEIWRIPAAGGTAERLTHGGGGSPYESPDGKTLFYMRRVAQPSTLLAMPLAGGPERELAKCVFAFAVVPAGIYSLDCSDAPEPLVVRDFSTGRARLLGKLDRGMRAPPDMSVSPDGKTILYAKKVDNGADLLLIENFR